jgi:GNAT superfamily N-acetyltransferase
LVTVVDEEALIHDSLAELTRTLLLEPLSEDQMEVRAWLDLELASLVEGHFGEIVDAGRLSPSERAKWEGKATYEGAGLRTPHDAFMLAFWILDEGKRVGTVAFGTTFMGSSLVSVHSLYIQPEKRRIGLAGRVLRTSFEAVRARGCTGLYIASSWTWPDAMRFYARLGLWVRGWKHSLVFTWQRELPDYRVETSAGAARFLVCIEGTWEPWFAAEPNGDELVWHDLRPNRSDDRLDEVHFLAPGTFALHLALEGWPLIRSREQWEARWRHSDCGEIEGLACKIEVFEAVARNDGYVIRTPRIPGIAYRDLGEI